MDELFCILLTVLVLLAVAIIRPDRARAPQSYYVDGIRPDGSTTFRHAPPLSCANEADGEHRTPCPHDGRAIDTRIYCTGGAQPIVVDDRTVGCQRGGWR